VLNLVILLEVIEQLDYPVLADIDASVSKISADGHRVALSQQASLHIQWHGLVSGAVCLENKSAHLCGPRSTHILHLGSLVRQVSESKDVIGLSGFTSFEFRLLRQIELFEHHSHRIVVEIMLVKDVAQRDVNQHITLHHDEIFLDYANGWIKLTTMRSFKSFRMFADSSSS